MKNYFLYLPGIILAGCGVFAHQKKSTVLKDRLTDRLTYDNFAVIRIEYGVERYKRYETYLIYGVSDDKDKIRIATKVHALIKEPSTSTEIDTIFTLTGEQIMIIDRFDNDVRNNNMNPTEGAYAGSRGYYEIIIDDNKCQLQSKKDYCLLRELIK